MTYEPINSPPSTTTSNLSQIADIKNEVLRSKEYVNQKSANCRLIDEINLIEESFEENNNETGNSIMPVLDAKLKKCTFCRGSSCIMYTVADCLFAETISNNSISIYVLKLPSFPLYTFRPNPFEPNEVCQVYSDLTGEQLPCNQLFQTHNNLVGDFAFLAATILIQDKVPPPADSNLCVNQCLYSYNVVFPSKRHLRSMSNSKAKCDLYIGLFSLDDDFIIQIDFQKFNRITTKYPNFQLKFIPCPEIVKHNSISIRVRKSTQNRVSFLVFPREYIHCIKIKSPCIYMTMQLILRTNLQTCNLINSTLLVKQDYRFRNKCHKIVP